MLFYLYYSNLQMHRITKPLDLERVCTSDSCVTAEWHNDLSVGCEVSLWAAVSRRLRGTCGGEHMDIWTGFTVWVSTSIFIWTVLPPKGFKWNGTSVNQRLSVFETLCVKLYLHTFEHSLCIVICYQILLIGKIKYVMFMLSGMYIYIQIYPIM